MRAPSRLFTGLVDDAAMFAPGNADALAAVSAHRPYRRAWFEPLVGPLVVSDHRLAEVGRALRQVQSVAGADHEELAVSVVNTTGAGGLVSLGGREVAGLRVVAVETALRDLDDLAANAARVVSAAAALDDQVSVFVEIPCAWGWERAVSEVEAAGLYAKVSTGGQDGGDAPQDDQLARQLSVLVEADLPFKATTTDNAVLGRHPGQPGRQGILNVLAAVEALVEGATETDAAELLGRTDGSLAVTISGWSDAQATRVRRRLRSFSCCGVLDVVGDLVELSLVEKPG